MKIVFITQFFFPDIQATSRIFTELCEDLARRHTITVICGAPEVADPGQGIAREERKERFKGIEIRRVFTTRGNKKNMMTRAANHVSFAIASCCAAFRVRKADLIVFTSDNPLNFICASRFTGTPKIYICQDLYLEQGLAIGVFRKGIFSRVMGSCQKAAFDAADKVVTVSESMKEHITNKMGVSAEKITVIPNWADVDKITPCAKENPFAVKNGLVDKFVVMHSGRVGLMQDLELLVDCASAMRGNKDVRFVIIGEGVAKKDLMMKADRKKLDNILFLPYQPEAGLKQSLAAADAGVVLYRETLSHCLVPSRLYSILSSGRPVIASAPSGSEMYRIIREARCGRTIDIGDRDGLLRAIEWMMEHPAERDRMGRAGREYAVRYCSRRGRTEEYMSRIEGLAKRGRE